MARRDPHNQNQTRLNGDSNEISEFRNQRPRQLWPAAPWGCVLDLRKRLRASDDRLSDVRIVTFLAEPRTHACAGHNDEEHRLATQRDPMEHPSIFLRHSESLMGSAQPMLRRMASTQPDGEGEIAAVIGKKGRRIDDAWAHIAGVSCFQEGRVRDWPHHTRQFGPGRNLARDADELVPGL
jgi:2-keto-4-pentenoate hydratase/2-oxohepta-3-ene-1,7-dioic acid hydratase in catechol pathway